MRNTILIGCLGLLSLASYSQGNGRVASGAPLRWAANGSIEVMDRELVTQYGSNDSNATNRRSANTNNGGAYGGNLNATRFATIQGVCDQGSVLLSWVAVQKFSADRYEIEQSSDGGRKWFNIGIVPANRTELGNASYSYNYLKSSGNDLFRVGAISTSGERVFSSIIESPCAATSFLALTPNPVYSTTNVRIGSNASTKIKIMLANSSGGVVFTRETGLLAGTNNVPLDMTNLPKGFYTVVVQWANGKQDVLKVIKQ